MKTSHGVHYVEGTRWSLYALAAAEGAVSVASNVDGLHLSMMLGTSEAEDLARAITQAVADARAMAANSTTPVTESEAANG